MFYAFEYNYYFIMEQRKLVVNIANTQYDVIKNVAAK